VVNFYQKLFADYTNLSKAINNMISLAASKQTTILTCHWENGAKWL